MAKKNHSPAFSREGSAVEPRTTSVVNPDAPSVDTTQPRDADSDPREARERIAARAYELYLQRGGAHGRETEDWLEAEREVSGSSRAPRSSSDR